HLAPLNYRQKFVACHSQGLARRDYVSEIFRIDYADPDQSLMIFFLLFEFAKYVSLRHPRAFVHIKSHVSSHIVNAHNRLGATATQDFYHSL
ncbi:hypothetical protein, partial [Pantoea ananatis]|uniref:hypothetical protein n=1 Tax=Pantoea ananas TaxID=553 RepID=UPI001B313444